MTHNNIAKMPCEQFLQKIEISRTFLRATQMGEKRGRSQFVVEIIIYIFKARKSSVFRK